VVFKRLVCRKAEAESFMLFVNALTWPVPIAVKAENEKSIFVVLQCPVSLRKILSTDKQKASGSTIVQIWSGLY